MRYQAEGREHARRGDALHLAGCMLFWAEGSKARNRIAFTNSDADMLVLFLRFLRQSYKVQDSEISFYCTCFLNNGLSIAQIESWWLKRLALPRCSLRPSIVNRPSSAGSGKHRTLLHGTGRIDVHSTELAQNIYGAIQEYAAIERPGWLDLPQRRGKATGGRRQKS